MSLFSPIRGVVLRYRRTCYQCCVSTCRKASLAAAKVCCSLLPETPTTTWQLPACTECSTRPARLQVGPDLRWHDLRQTGAVRAASAGASLAELMARLGHSTACQRPHRCQRATPARLVGTPDMTAGECRWAST